MTCFKDACWLALLLPAITVSAHGHVDEIIINGVSYQGYGSTDFPYMENPPVVAGWILKKPRSKFLKFLDLLPNFDSSSSRGPCERVDKTELEFFKIDGLGQLEQGTPGRYADSVLQENGDRWNVRIPENIASGNYVLRHEIIALHNALERGGAQNYPQCFNLRITGDGSDSPSGYLGTELYDVEDPGILVNVYSSSVDYEVPGPTIVEGGVSSVEQSPSRATTTAKCTTRY
uniref:lytic cellulose monooxygenase (C4-dehydrogenating) n=1 Tax=Fusarium oxysporum (strain Fo5176) TaxID=660025 RepID=A0A0D2XV13_FUSOF